MRSSAARRSEAVLAAARGWIGTPFVAGAAVRGVGCDCVGFIAGALADAVLELALPDRDPDPGVAGPALLAWARSSLIERPRSVGFALLVFSERPGGPARHAGLATGAGTFIHAHWRCGVIERPLIAWWRARRVAAFTLTELPWRP